MQRQPRDRVHQHRLAEGRAAARDGRADRSAFPSARTASGTNSVKPPVRACSARRCSRCRAQCTGSVDMAEHDRRRGAQADAMRRLDHLEPLLRSSPCPGRSPRGPRRRGSRPRCRAACRARHPSAARRNAATGMPSVAAPCQISSGEKAWTCMSGTASLIARQIAR